jgi:hypothetical protein
MDRTDRTAVSTDIVKGALAGAAATWVMDQLTTRMYERESDRTREREERARGESTAYGAAAEKAARAGGVELSDERREHAGQAIHWALGMAAGAAYAVMRRRCPAAARLKGLPFGTGFLLVDEGLNPILGLTPGPQAFPWQTHARGLGGHLAFGLVSEMVLERLDRVA